MRKRWEKIKRYFGITKPIPLSTNDARWIKLCKGHYSGKYTKKGSNWIDILKPLFIEIYGYNPDEHYLDFTTCIFFKLWEIYRRINEDKNSSYKDLFFNIFYKSIARNYNLPIERGIATLCGLIQSNSVINKFEIARYNLDINE